jgi:hypothetical protein
VLWEAKGHTSVTLRVKVMPLLAGALAEPCMKGTNPEAFLSSLLALATIVLIASEDKLGSVRPSHRRRVKHAAK